MKLLLSVIIGFYRTLVALLRRSVPRLFFWVVGLLSFGELGVLESRAQTTSDSEAAGQALIAQPALTLEGLLQQVDAYHPKLRSANAERRIADAKLVEKQGAFDPVIQVGSEYLRFNSTSVRGRVGTARQTEASIEWLTRSGVKVFSGSRFNLGTVKSPLSSTGDGGEYFSGVMLPLFRDRGINEKSAAESQAFLGLPLADAEFNATRLDVMFDASLSYWDWVAAQRRLEINRNLLELARVRANQVRDRVRTGDLPPIDETEANQEVQRRQGSLVKAERDLQKANFKLALYLWEDQGRPAQILNTVQPPPNLRVPVAYTAEQVQSGIARALARRPELQGIVIERSIADIDSQLARNARRPAVDLYLAPGRDTGFGSIGTTMKMGVSISLPVRRRQAEGQLAAAQLKIRKLDFDEQNERQRIITEVSDAASAINTTYERFLITQREVELARELERGERARFALGDSTLFLVNQRERAAAEAETKLIDVYAEYEQSIAAFRAATVQY